MAGITGSEPAASAYTTPPPMRMLTSAFSVIRAALARLFPEGSLSHAASGHRLRRIVRAVITHAVD